MPSTSTEPKFAKCYPGSRLLGAAIGLLLMTMFHAPSYSISHSVAPLYFGLGDADAVDGIEVVWTSGRKQELAGPIEGNRTLWIREPDA